MKKIFLIGGIGIAILVIVAVIVVAVFLDGIVKEGVETLGPKITWGRTTSLPSRVMAAISNGRFNQSMM